MPLSAGSRLDRADLAGRIVFALHPHQSLFDVPAEAVVPLPDGVPPARAVLAANMETALNAVWDAAPGRPTASPLSARAWSARWLAFLLRRLAPGADVTLVDINPSRAELARGAWRAILPRPTRRRPIAISSCMPAPPRRDSPPRSTSPATRPPCWS